MAVRQSTHRFFVGYLRRDNGEPPLFLRSDIGVVSGKTVWESSTKYGKWWAV
jgi:hypothetical protein